MERRGFFGRLMRNLASHLHLGHRVPRSHVGWEIRALQLFDHSPLRIGRVEQRVTPVGILWHWGAYRPAVQAPDGNIHEFSIQGSEGTIKQAQVAAERALEELRHARG